MAAGDVPILEEFLGGNTGGKLDKDFIETVLRVVDSGRELLRVESDPNVSGDRALRGKVSDLWKVHKIAEDAISKELARRRERAAKREKDLKAEQALMNGLSRVPDDDEDEDGYADDGPEPY